MFKVGQTVIFAAPPKPELDGGVLAKVIEVLEDGDLLRVEILPEFQAQVPMKTYRYGSSRFSLYVAPLSSQQQEMVDMLKAKKDLDLSELLLLDDLQERQKVISRFEKDRIRRRKSYEKSDKKSDDVDIHYIKSEPRPGRLAKDADIHSLKSKAELASPSRSCGFTKADMTCILKKGHYGAHVASNTQSDQPRYLAFG